MRLSILPITLTSMLLSGTAIAAAPSVAEMGVDPTTSPESLLVQDKNGAWVTFGRFTPGVNRSTEGGALYNLKNDFGAACDGVTDDTAAIQSWLAKAASGVRLVIPAGVCNFNTPLASPTVNNFTISGSGVANSVLHYTGSATSSVLLALTGYGILPQDFSVALGAATWKAVTLNGVAFTPPSPANIRIVNVLDFGADPTGTVDSTAAFNLAFTIGTNSNNPSSYTTSPRACVYAPAGDYIITNALTPQANAACLYGDGKVLTNLAISSSTFNLAAKGVIVLASTTGNGVEVHDLAITFTQPDVASRGSLVAFPPGIYMQDAGRQMVHDVRIQGGGLYCIDARGNTGGDFFNNIECGALTKGLMLGGPATYSGATSTGAHDGVHITNWHAWNFGISSVTTPGLAAIQGDGTNLCMEIGWVDWGGYANIQCNVQNIVISAALGANSSTDASHWVNVVLDKGLWQQSGGKNLVSNFSDTFGSDTAPGNAGFSWTPAIAVSGGTLSLSNSKLEIYNPNAAGGISVTGGQLTITGSPAIRCYDVGNPCVLQTGGLLEISGSQFIEGAGISWGATPYVQVTGVSSIAQISNNWFTRATVASNTAISVGTDVLGNYVVNNYYGNWVNSFPTSTSITSYGENFSVANPSNIGTITLYGKTGYGTEYGLGVYPNTDKWFLANNSVNQFKLVDLAASANWLLLTSGGAATIGESATSVLSVTGVAKLGTVFSAAGTALPTCNAGAAGTIAYVSDATAPTYNATYTSGGAVKTLVLCNGTNWTTH